jgi:hypothetical protein
MMDARIIVASLLHHFDIQLAPEFDLAKFEAEGKDHFLLAADRLPVIITKRKV